MAEANVIETSMPMDVRDTLNKKLAILSANLSMTFGECQTAFVGQSLEIQENFLWGCFELVEDCIALMDKR
jgi:hypothetical protein